MKKIIIILSIIIILFFISVRFYYIRDSKNKIEKLKIDKNIDEEFRIFPKYYINLNRSKDRRKHMEDKIEYYNLKNIKRVKAFDGSKITDLKNGKIDGYSYKSNCKGIPNNKASELAISMSHIYAINQAYLENHDSAIIMEDDVDFFLCPKWEKNFKDILKEIPEDCEILLLANNSTGELKIKSIKDVNTRVSGVCYLVTKKGMEKINKFLNDKQFIFPENLPRNVWDEQILNRMNIYHTGKSLFLLYNFNFNSDRTIELLHFDNDSYKILNSYL
jgi:hypothetical protein